MGGKTIQLHIMPTTTVFWQCNITVRHCKVVDTLKPLSQTHIYATMYTDRWWRRDGRVQVILARDTGGRWCGWMAVLYHVFITPATHTDNSPYETTKHNWKCFTYIKAITSHRRQCTQNI